MNRWRLWRLPVGFILAIAAVCVLLGVAGATGGGNRTLPLSLPSQTLQASVDAESTVLTTTLPPLCRYGVTAAGEAQLNWLSSWRVSWVVDFGAHLPVPGVATQQIPMVWVRQNKNGCAYLDGYTSNPPLTEAGLGALVHAMPGSTWIIGNEPDRGPNPENCAIGSQGDMMPEMYARAYHDIYTFIKQRDRSARIANAGLVQVTPGRLQYLDKVWQAYQSRYGSSMQVDIWNMHLYILPEALADGQPNGIAGVAVGTDPGLAIRESGGDPSRCADPNVYCYAEHDDMTNFAQQIVSMRTWMKQHSQQAKPLILSEYSVLYPYDLDPEGCFLQDEFGNCFTPQRVSRFMTRTFEYMETAVDATLGYPMDGYHLVQRWLWYSAHTNSAGRASNLLTGDFRQLTSVGDTFRAEAEARSSHVNLLPGQIGGTATQLHLATQTVTATLWAEVYNNGSVSTTSPFSITFYADSALTQVIGSASVPAAIDGCTVGMYRVVATWRELGAGIHPFWVKVDSGDAVAESSETDNVMPGSVFVPRGSIYLPIVRR